MTKLGKFLAGYFRRWQLDSSEQEFREQAKQLSMKPASSSGAARTILVQIAPDYQCLAKFLGAIRELGDEHSRLIGLWHLNVQSLTKRARMQAMQLFVRKVLNYLDFRKWRKLYHAIGISDEINLSPALTARIANWRQAKEIWLSLHTKEDLLNLHLNGVHCGDLIYDTYLRFRVEPTVDLRDAYLRYLIAKALDAQAAMRAHIQRLSPEILLTNYSSYIQHGIPVREAVRAGVRVFSCGNLTQNYKKLSIDDTLHTEAFWLYADRFDQVPNKGEARSAAKAELEHRFAGGVDKATAYMKASAYTADAAGTLPEGIQGVVFLHDFFDSPHCHRDIIFPDFYEWVHFTLKTIVEHNLPLAVKPHPNQLPESAAVVETLKSAYPSVCFLDPKMPNNIIFRSGVKCGISVYGTVLSELVYHGIPALACGDHPHVAFNIAHLARSTDEYRELLIGFRNIQLPENAREQVLDYYYAHRFLPKEDLDVDFGSLDVSQLEQNDSNALKTILAQYAPLQAKRGNLE